MNIAIVNQWYPPFSVGGVAQYNEYLVKALNKRGHGVTVVATLVSKSQQFWKEDGVEVYRLKMSELPHQLSVLPVLGPQHRFVRNLIYSKVVSQFLRNIVETKEIELVEYAEINGEGFYHRKYLGNLPYVVRCHTPYYLLERTYEPGEMPFSCRFINWMEKRTIKRADGITAPSQDLARRIEEWCKIPKGSVKAIPNLIDTDWFHPHPDHTPGDVVKILFVGRVEKAKGIFVLADAIQKVIDRYQKVRFVFVGEPRSQKGLEDFKNYLKQLGIDRYCEFTGPVSMGSLREHYQQCDVFVNPSYIYESFSYTNAEAMACGKPVVTSDVGGMPDTVGNMIGGLVFRVKDSEDLSKKLLALIGNRELRDLLGKQARERSLNYSIGKVIDCIVNFYQSLQSK